MMKIGTLLALFTLYVFYYTLWQKKKLTSKRNQGEVVFFVKKLVSCFLWMQCCEGMRSHELVTLIRSNFRNSPRTKFLFWMKKRNSNIVHFSEYYEQFFVPSFIHCKIPFLKTGPMTIAKLRLHYSAFYFLLLSSKKCSRIEPTAISWKYYNLYDLKKKKLFSICYSLFETSV